MLMEGFGSRSGSVQIITHPEHWKKPVLIYILVRSTSGSCWTTWPRTTGRRWSPPTSPTSAPSAPPPLASISSSRTTSTLLTRASPRRPTRPNRPVFLRLLKLSSVSGFFSCSKKYYYLFVLSISKKVLFLFPELFTRVPVLPRKYR